MSEIESKNTSEKRKYSRYALPLSLYVNTKGEKKDRLDNISEGGACFQSEDTFQENDFIFFHFSGDSDSSLKDVKFSILGKIMWHSENNGDLCKYGAQFKFYDDPFFEKQHAAMMSVLERYSDLN